MEWREAVKLVLELLEKALFIGAGISTIRLIIALIKIKQSKEEE